MQMKNVKIATQRLIDSVWTIVYTELDNGTAYLHRYTRDERLGYRLEKDCPKGRVIESEEGRIAKKLVIDDKELSIINQAHIFSYC